MNVLRRSESRGVSLILELLLGFSLVTIALLAVFRIFPTAERASVLADKSTHAHHLAGQVLEAQLNRPYSAISVGVFEAEEPIKHTKRRGVEVETVYRYRLDISRPYPGKEIFNIAVSVTWEDGSEESPRPSQIRLEADKGRLW